jgi:hypothetical protein
MAAASGGQIALFNDGRTRTSPIVLTIHRSQSIHLGPDRFEPPSVHPLIPVSDA